VGVHGVDSADQFDFLLEGELGDPGVGLGFDFGRVGNGRLGEGGDGCGEGGNEQHGDAAASDAEGRNRRSNGGIRVCHDAEKANALGLVVYTTLAKPQTKRGYLRSGPEPDV